jgi:hypothetical protein
MTLTTLDLYDSAILVSKALSTLSYLPQTHISAFEAYAQTFAPQTSSPYMAFHSTILSIHSTIIAMLLALSRPTSLISSINTSRKTIERSYNSLSRSTRWPLGLLDDTRQRLNEEKEDKVRRTREEVNELGRELRYTQGVVAAELAGWQDLHEKMGRKAIKDLARAMLIKERSTLEGMKRAIRKLKITPQVVLPVAKVGVNGGSSSDESSTSSK